MKRSLLQMICKGSKNMQRVGSKLLGCPAKNVKIVSINIQKITNTFQTSCI